MMYLQVITKPDISFAVNTASRALEIPSEYDLTLASEKNYALHLKGTLDVRLFYRKSGDK